MTDFSPLCRSNSNTCGVSQAAKKLSLLRQKNLDKDEEHSVPRTKGGEGERDGEKEREREGDGRTHLTEPRAGCDIVAKLAKQEDHEVGSCGGPTL